MSAIYFSSEKKAEGVELIGRPATAALITADGDNWRAVKTHQSFSSGRHFVEIEIARDAATTNTWRVVVGAVPSSFDCTQRSYTCVGSQQGGWGYVGGTGKKYRKALGDATAYGPTFTTGDVIGVLLDFPKKSISFFKNKQDLGTAFTDLAGSVNIAVSLTARDAKVTIREGSDPEAKDSAPAVSDKDRLTQLETDFFHKFSGAHVDLNHPYFASPLSELVSMGFTQLDALEALLVCSDGPQSDVRNEQDLHRAIDYLFATPSARKARYDEAVKNRPASSANLGSNNNNNNNAFGPNLMFPSSSSSFPFSFTASNFAPSSIASAIGVGNAPSGFSLPAPPTNASSSLDARMKQQIAQLRSQFVAERSGFEAERKTFDRELYKEVLAACVVDEHLNRHKLDKLEQLRSKKNISMNVHEQILLELGMNKDRFTEMVRKARDDEELLRKMKKDAKAQKLNVTANECVICIDKPAEFIIMECMHLCLCEGCRSRYTGSACPSCTRPIKEIRKVY